MAKTSKLWRTFGADQDLFEVYSPDFSTADGYVRDGAIRSISIDAGTTMAGLSTAAAEVNFAQYQGLDYSSDKPITVALTQYGSELLAGTLGVSAGSIRDRFRGRIAGQTITDNGAAGLVDKITAQDWASFISQLDLGGIAEKADPSVWRSYRSVFGRAGVSEIVPLESWGSTWHWVKWPDEEPEASAPTIQLSTSDIFGKFCADLGNLVSISRDGTPRAWSHDHLQALGDNWQTISPHPLQRSQVLKPVEWTRTVSIPAQLNWLQWTGIGSSDVVAFTFPPPNGIAHRVDELDMRHIWDIHATPTTSGLKDVMWARVTREANIDPAVEKVRLDLLGLFQRNQGTDRALIGQVLKMTHGDPIVLGWDWPAPVSGVYFAQRIAHKITPDSWEVEIELVPTLHVTGWEPLPDLAGQTWETAYPRATTWDNTTTPWEESP